MSEDRAVLDAATKVAMVMQVILEMSDDVTKGRSPLDTQGRLLKLQQSIQKNRPRIRTLCDALARALDDSKAS